MSRFEEHLWREFEREHGDALTEMHRPSATHTRLTRPRLVVGAGLGLAGSVGVIVLLLGTTTASPAFAVTRNHDGTVSISITRSSGVGGANAELRHLGIRATVMSQAPSGCQPTLSHPPGGQAAPAPSQATHEIANAHWTINPRQIPKDSTLALTPPPIPPGQDSGNSGGSGSDGQYWECGTEDPGGGPPPPTPPGQTGGNGGASGNS